MLRLTVLSCFSILFLNGLLSGVSVAQTETPHISQSMADGVLAFPGAEGFGRFTTGGRGGTVYEVTNLNDSGTGSLRAAVEATGARTVVFRVSGTIHLVSELKIQDDDISIFGQTAPGDGIATKGYNLRIAADNVIIQYLRMRPGDISGAEPDAIWGREQTDIIIDHCSMSWSVDETASFYDNVNFTLQWNILSESLYESVHDKGQHGYGGIWGGQGATFHHNLLAHHTSRNPRFNGSRYSGRPDLELVDYRNNVIYNWGDNSAYGGEKGNQNMIANYYKPGPATPDGEKSYRILDAKPPSGDFAMLGKWHIEDNVVVGFRDVSEDNWDGGVQRVSQAQMDTIRVMEAFPAPELPSFETAEEAYLNVLANAGAVLPKRDSLDQRIIEETKNGEATYGGVFGEYSGIIDTQVQVGGWPVLESATAPDDSDHDGIPDNWETENGLDPESPADGKEITDSGYSNLELYIHSLSDNSVKEPIPANPILISPVQQINVEVQTAFIWNEAVNASKYQVNVSDSDDEVLLDTVVTDTSFVITDSAMFLEGNTYHKWRVRGINADGITGGWSTSSSFVTGTATSTENETLPGEFKLDQNYPNPFNPSTVISYQLSVNSAVSLKVFDMLGREVATLVDGKMNAGSHEVTFDAGSLASGIYMYQLTGSMPNGERLFQTRKMTLLK